MKFVLFALREPAGHPVAIAGVTDQGDRLDPVELMGSDLQVTLSELKKSIQTRYPKATVIYTDDPESHPDVQKALFSEDDSLDTTKKNLRADTNTDFLCVRCTHLRVCAVSTSIAQTNLNAKVTECDAYSTYEEEPDV